MVLCLYLDSLDEKYTHKFFIDYQYTHTFRLYIINHLNLGLSL